jgi:uncharacterized membrane protein YraQ (UPF0718 family)
LRKRGILFLIGVLLIYFVVLIINPQLIFFAFRRFYKIFLGLIPILIFVFSMMFLSNLFFKKQIVIKYLNERKKLIGWIGAIISGIISTGPIYVWYPLLKELREKGMRNSLIITFLYNRAVKIPLLPMMVYYFGLLFTIVLTVYMIIFSIINGIIVEKILFMKSGRSFD